MDIKTYSSGEYFDHFFAGFTAYYLTSVPAVPGVLFAIDLPQPTSVSSAPRPDFGTACIHFDAVLYVKIARESYTYDPARRSLVAFFPAYPLVSRWVSQVTGLAAEEASLLTAHVALLGASARSAWR